MLQKYIKNILGQMDASEKQKHLVLDMLRNIKTNEDLFSEFQTIESIEIIEGENVFIEQIILPVNHSLFDEEINLLPEDSNPQETFALDLSSVIDAVVPTLESTISPEALSLESQEEQAELPFDGEETFYEGIFDLIPEQEPNTSSETKVSTSNQENQSTILASTTYSTASHDADKSKLGRYLNIGVLGKGGMGEVLKVKDQVLNRDLAMKIIHPNILQNKSALARFIEEAQICAQLQHPNIVPIHELGILPDGRYYFTMKEINGIEFTELIHAVHDASAEQVWRTTPDGITFRRLIQIFHTICETMAFAHSNGVIHRDLKPENIMIGDFGEVLVVDWGIAKVLGQNWEMEDDLLETIVQTDRSEGNTMATQMGMIAGTPAYMSPEQARGEIKLIKAQSDVYTLGAILYQILSGRPPYTGVSALEIVEKVKITKPLTLLTTITLNNSIEENTPINLEEFEEGKIPRPLVDICEKAMEREIEYRYSSAGEFAKEILNWLEGAQKRDKALKEFEAATDILNKAIENEASYTENWSLANQTIKQQNLEKAKSWVQWLTASSALKEAQQLRRDYRRMLQGALVYDIALEEANEALAVLLLEDIIIAQAKGEREQREILERQFKGYLQHLSKRRQGELKASLDEKKQDKILLLRAQRGGLVGRKRQRKEIMTTLKERSRLVSLLGTAGVGKTRLALEVIHDLQEPETKTYFCNLTEATSELAVALFVAKAMNVKLRNVDPIGQLGELFAEQSTILVLDNLEQIVEDVGTVITRWMDQSDSLRIIATSRIKLRLPQEHSFPIQPLSLLEGMELFTTRGQQADGQFVLNEKTRNTVGHLVQQLDALPLAIELAAARLNIFSVKEVAERLKERFSLLRSRSKGTQALQGALDWSWDLLKPWAKAALSQSSVFRSGFDGSAAESILNCGDWKEDPPVFDILQDLSENSLLQQNKSSEGNIRYGILESIRQYSRTKLQNEKAVEQELSGEKANRKTELRHSRYFSKFGQKEYLDSLDNEGNLRSWGTFFEDLDNFIAGTEYGSGETASLCCMAAMKILGMKGPISLGVNVVEGTLEKTDLSTRQRKQLEILQTRFLRISGRMNEARGKRVIQQPSIEVEHIIEENTSENQARFSEEEKHRFRIQADNALEKGNLKESEASYKKALEYYNQAFNIYQKIGDLSKVTEALQRIAEVFREQELYEKALHTLEQALQIAETHNFTVRKTHIYSSLGTTYYYHSKYKKSLVFYHKVLEANQNPKDQTLEHRTLRGLGTVHLKLEQNKEALKYYKRSAEIANKIGDTRAEGLNLESVAHLHRKSGQYQAATKYYKQALEVARELGDKRGEGVNLANMGNLYKNLGQYEEAIKSFHEALEVVNEIENNDYKIACLGNLGNIYSSLGQHEEATKSYLQSITIARECGDKIREGLNLGNLGNVYRNTGMYKESIGSFSQSIKIAQEIGNKRNEGINLGNLGDVFLRLNQLEKAKKHFIQAIDICEKAFPFGVGVFSGSLALVYATQRNCNEALSLLETNEKIVAINPLEYGKFLCKKAKVYHLAMKPAQAKEYFEQAEAIASDLKINKASELQNQLLETKVLLSQDANSFFDKAKTEELSTEQKEDLRVEADSLLEKGNLEEAEAFYDEALGYYNQASRIYQRIGELKGLVETLQKVAVVFKEQGRNDKALLRLEEALQIADENGFNAIKAKIYTSFGDVYQLQSKHEEALDFLQKALAVNKNLNNRFLESKILESLGNIFQRLTQYEDAIKYYKQALSITKTIGDKRMEGNILRLLGNIFLNLGKSEDAILYYQQSIEIARECGDKRSEGLNLGNLGNVFLNLGKSNETIVCFQQSIEIAREIGDKRSEGVNLGNLGAVYKNLGKPEKAIAYFQQSIELSKECGNKVYEGLNLGNLGTVLVEQDRWEEAKDKLLQAIEICEAAVPLASGVFRGVIALSYAKKRNFEKAFEELQKGEPLIVAIPFEYGKFLCKKAKVYSLANKPEQANQALQHAEKIATDISATEDSELRKEITETTNFLSQEIEIPKKLSIKYLDVENLSFEQKEDLRVEADDLLEKGNIEEAESFYDDALKYYNQASTIYQRIGELKGLVETLQKIAVVFQEQGNFEHALQKLEQALQIADENGFKSTKVTIYTSLGTVYHSKSMYPKALEIYQKALDINKNLNDRFHESQIFENLGIVYSKIGQKEKAISYFQQTITIARECGNKRREGINLGNLGGIYANLAQYEEALRYYKQAIDIAREIGDKRREGINLGNVGNVSLFLGQNNEAITYYKRAIDIAREIGDKRGEGINLGSLGSVYTNLGQYEEAIESFQQAITLSLEIGNKINEGINLGNIGDLFLKLNRSEEAKEYFIKAIQICEISIPPAAGAFQGSLAFLYAQQGNFEEAFVSLEKGESLITIDPLEHGKFLCKKAKILYLAKQDKQAIEALQHATTIATELNASNDSELRKGIKTTKAFLSEQHPLRP